MKPRVVVEKNKNSYTAYIEIYVGGWINTGHYGCGNNVIQAIKDLIRGLEVEIYSLEEYIDVAAYSPIEYKGDKRNDNL